MTIIAVSPGEMAADSFAFANYVGYPIAPGRKKIIRCEHGLVGMAGNGPELQVVREWIERGMPWTDLPQLSDKEEDGIGVLWLKTDGTLWHFNQKFRPYEVSIPWSIGQEHASHMAEGAMLAGKTAGEALALVVPYCTHVGGPIQVERLAPVGNPDSIIEIRYGEQAPVLCRLIPA
jgi:hypothetical protein